MAATLGRKIRFSGAMAAGAVIRIAGVAALAAFLVGVPASSASATFPGRNGLLVVQPANGRGLVLLPAAGANTRQLCNSSIRCDGARDPLWSPDGSQIVFEAPAPQSQTSIGIDVAPFVLYADGSCFACAVPAFPGMGYPFYWSQQNRAGFLPDGELAVSLDEYGAPPGQLGSVGVDGIGFQPFAVSGSWRQAAWSANGQLAAVRAVGRRPEVFLIDPRTGSAHRLTRGGADSPDWSPDGRRLAVVHAGWIEIIGLGGGPARRLVRGDAPAWSPDGRKLAFVDAHHRVFVISARGGRPRRIGKVLAVHVDWQPLTGHTSVPCQAPPGSIVVAASPDAIVTTRPPRSQAIATNSATSFLGCLRSDGRERLLESFSPANGYAAGWVTSAALAGAYAAVVNFGSSKYGGTGSDVVVFDLRNGAIVPDRGGEAVGCTIGYCNLDQLVLGPDAVTAAHTSATVCAGPSDCTTTEQIVVNDIAGTRTLDTVTATTASYQVQGAAPLLTGLTLTGDTLTWNHDGTPRTAQLHG